MMPHAVHDFPSSTAIPGVVSRAPSLIQFKAPSPRSNRSRQQHSLVAFLEVGEVHEMTIHSSRTKAGL